MELLGPEGFLSQVTKAVLVRRWLRVCHQVEGVRGSTAGAVASVSSASEYFPFRACLDPDEHPGLHVVVQRIGDEEVQRAEGQVGAGDVQDGEPDQPRHRG